MKLLYDYWFTQFDFPDSKGNPYRTSGGQMIWNEQLKQKIPLNWNVTTLDTFIDFLSGYSFSSSIYQDKGKFKLLTIKNVQDDGIDTNVDNYIEYPPSNVPEYCYLKQKDLLMSLTGNVGRVGIMYSDDCLLNQRVSLVRPKKATLLPYVYLLLKSEKIRKAMESISNGSSQKNLSPIETGKLLVPFNEKTAVSISLLTDDILSTIVSNYAENEHLSKIRDWLLPMLMNGQAVVQD